MERWEKILTQKEFAFDGHIVGSDKPVSFTVGAEKISLEDRADLAKMALIPGYRVPALLDEAEIWQELKSLCYRVIYEMRETAIATETVNNPRFVPTAYDKTCLSMLKLRDVIDEIRARGSIASDIEAPWLKTELFECLARAENDDEDLQ